jgi:tetratricopeptide (TPR) repeat protein
MDWIVGYGSPPDLFLKRVQKALAGTDTYRALNDRYAKEPNNVEVVFKLAQKLEGRESGMAKTKELYRKVVLLDPDGKSGSYNNEYLKASITYTEAAEEALGRIAFFSRENDPAPLRAFIAKFPESKFLKDEYALLARFYYLRNSVPKDEASKFFAEYTSKYPYEADVLNSYVERIISDKEPLDKGIELADKIKEIVGNPPNPGYVQNLAQLYVLKGDLAKADEEYGKDFIDAAVDGMIYWLTGYANFWIKQNKNLESVEAMADMAAKMAPPSQWRALQAVVNIYLKLDKTDKALGIYGPEFVKKHMADQDVLLSYATFWNGQGKNLDSALEAARRAVELTSDYYNNYTVANILFKLKKYDEALKYAEKAAELVKPMAVKYQGFPTQQYDKLVKDIKEAQAKEKAPVVKK